MRPRRDRHDARRAAGLDQDGLFREVDGRTDGPRHEQQHIATGRSVARASQRQVLLARRQRVEAMTTDRKRAWISGIRGEVMPVFSVANGATLEPNFGGSAYAQGMPADFQGIIKSM